MKATSIIPSDFIIRGSEDPFSPEELPSLPEVQRIIEIALMREKFISRSVTELSDESGLSIEIVISYCNLSTHIARSPFTDAKKNIFYGLLYKLLTKYELTPDGEFVERFEKLRRLTGANNAEYDFFISHASEDKEDFVMPLALALEKLGVKVWFDEHALRVGSHLRRAIDKGLSLSRFGIVVFSEPFFFKSWPQYELDGLVQRHLKEGNVLLPIWHKVSKDDVMQHSPSLSDIVALNSSVFTISEIAQQLKILLDEATNA